MLIRQLFSSIFPSSRREATRVLIFLLEEYSRRGDSTWCDRLIVLSVESAFGFITSQSGQPRVDDDSSSLSSSTSTSSEVLVLIHTGFLLFFVVFFFLSFLSVA